jgi:hypothetical protein
MHLLLLFRWGVDSGKELRVQQVLQLPRVSLEMHLEI